MEIKRVGVVGCGTMGSGIVLACARSGYEVVTSEINDELLKKGLATINAFLTKSVEKGKITNEEKEATLARIRGTTSMQDFSGCDLVIEAAIEDIELKKKIFSNLNKVCPESAILASNTSALLLKDIAAHCRRKDRVVITHWINPPHLVPLVEVVRGKDTSAATMELAYNLLKKLEKVPVKIMREIPGFILNRLQAALMRETWSLWQQGIASAEDIDLAMKASLGFRWAAIGPLETADLGGLDIFYKVMGRLFEVISDSHQPPEELRKMIESGKLGLKSGQGFYDYDVSYFEEGEAARVKERDRKHIQLLKLWYS